MPACLELVGALDSGCSANGQRPTANGERLLTGALENLRTEPSRRVRITAKNRRLFRQLLENKWLKDNLILSTGKETVMDWLGSDGHQRDLGEQIRRGRISLNLTQDDLATHANISVSAVRALEAGRGSSLRSFIRAIGALDRQEWLGQLWPDTTLSPVEIMRDLNRAQPRQRASSARSPKATSTTSRP